MAVAPDSNADSGQGPADFFHEFFGLTSEEEAALTKALGPVQAFARDHVLRRDGEDPTWLYVLVEGWVAASIPLTSGKQQIIKIHLPTDLMGSPSLCVTRTAERLTAVTPITVRRLSRSDLMALFLRYPRIAASLFFSAQKERVVLMDAMALLGQTEGGPRIAGMLVNLHDRLALLGRTDSGAFQLHLTQEQIGDLVGLTPVHVNRKLKELSEAGLIERTARTMRLVDSGRLRALANMPNHQYQRDPDWIAIP